MTGPKIDEAKVDEFFKKLLKLMMQTNIEEVHNDMTPEQIMGLNKVGGQTISSALGVLSEVPLPHLMMSMFVSGFALGHNYHQREGALWPVKLERLG